MSVGFARLDILNFVPDASTMSVPSANPTSSQDEGVSRFGSMGRPGFLKLLAVVPFVLHSGCKSMRGGHLTPKDIDPKAELNYHNWWNYYLRGQARMLAGDLEGARDDFLTCIGERKGATRILKTDRWQARTYGTHWIVAYFPNRELGIALTRLGKTEKALAYLKKSRDATDSGRARHFQALGRRKIIASKPRAPKPSIRFPQVKPLPAGAAKPIHSLANKRPTILTGTDILPLRTVAEAGDFIGEVEINARPIWLEAADPQIDRTDSIPLLPGQTDVEVSVTDLRGQRTVATVAVIADWRAPTIHLEPIADPLAGGAPIEIVGRCTDDNGVQSLTLNGKPIAPEGFREVIAPGGPAVLCARDFAGNQRLVDLFAPAGKPVARQARRPHAPDAHQEPDVHAPDVHAPAGGPPLRRALDLVANELTTDLLSSLAAARPGPSGAPVLTLEGMRPVITTERRRYYMEGAVRVPGGIDSLTINGKEWLVPSEKGSTLDLFFGGWLPLRDGENRFTVVARDPTGKQTQKAFTVVRSNTGLDRRLRLHAGVVPLDVPGAAAQNPKILRLPRDLERAFLNTPYRIPPRFQLFVRDPSVWKRILVERRISASNVSEKSARLALGRQTATDVLFECTVISHDEGVTLAAHCIDSSTGDVFCRDDVYIPSTDPQEPIAGLADKLERRFPLLTAPVKKLMRGELVVPLGRNDGVADWSTFLLFPTADFDTPRRANDGLGESRTEGTPLRFCIKSLGDNSCTLRLMDRTPHGPFEETDYVHTR